MVRIVLSTLTATATAAAAEGRGASDDQAVIDEDEQPEEAPTDSGPDLPHRPVRAARILD